MKKGLLFLNLLIGIGACGGGVMALLSAHLMEIGESHANGNRIPACAVFIARGCSDRLVRLCHKKITIEASFFCSSKLMQICEVI